MKPFVLAMPPKIIFGKERINGLARIVLHYGKKALIVTGGKSFYSPQNHLKISIEKDFAHENISFEYIKIDKEPTPEMIDDAVSTYRAYNADIVIAIGGGSVLDAGKAIAAMLKHDESVVTYLEGVGTKLPNGNKLPFVAIPTTSGTGSEATKNAVITKQGNEGFKKSLRHDKFVPDVAIVDPLLTLTCSPELTAACGMDAFTQLLESYTSTQANVLTDAMALSAIEKLITALPKAVADGKNEDAREAMSYASLVGGICLANAGLGTVHGFAQPLGSLFDIPHGVVCGTLMAVCNDYTIKRLIQTGDNPAALHKFANVGKLFSGFDMKADDYYAILLVENLYELTEKLKIPSLKHFHVHEHDVEAILNQTDNKNNPIQLSRNDLKEILLKRI